MTLLARLAYLRKRGDQLLEERARLLARLLEVNSALDKIAAEVEALHAEVTTNGS